MATISLLIPHKHDTANDAALVIALSCIATNTVNDYELLVDSTTPGNPYAVINSLAVRARGDYIVFMNSDTFVSPGWDVPMLTLAARNVIVAPTLVEPLAIGVFPGNITKDFGMRPETFRRAEFEAWAATSPAIPDHDPFFFYGLMRRADFISDGMFDLTLGAFPFPVDIHYWRSWQDKGRKVVRSASYIYHLQNYSNHEEQIKSVRWV